MRHRRALIVAALFLLLVPAARAATHEVTVVSFQFIPAEITIAVGDTVHWTIEAGGHNVAASDGSFRSGSPGAVSSFSHTFNQVGTFSYHCEPHAIAGMVGLVKVSQGGGGGEQRGTLKLATTAANVVEGNQVTLQVLRISGDDGPVSVAYSVEAGTAQAADFVPETGTLSWADNDDDPKAIVVRTNEDAAAEGNETVRVLLSNPTGGATLEAAGSTGTVTIQDDDAGGAAPSAPANLQAHAHSTTEVMLTWNDSNGETGYRIEQKTLGGEFQQVATAPANATSATVGGLTPATFYTFRIRAENGAGLSGYSNEAGVATNAAPAPCVETATTLCLNNGRFQVDVDWRAGTQGGPATAIGLDFAPESGLFYFSSPGNIEMLVKVLNACNPVLGNRYWVFYAATTNVELTMTVIDTQNGMVKVYHNPENNPAAPVQDTNAFATCP